jgi:hypothetical protein
MADETAAEGDDIVLALAARGTVADEDERSLSGGVGRSPQKAGDDATVTLDVETALADAFGNDVVSGPAHDEGYRSQL